MSEKVKYVKDMSIGLDISESGEYYMHLDVVALESKNKTRLVLSVDQFSDLSRGIQKILGAYKDRQAELNDGYIIVDN